MFLFCGMARRELSRFFRFFRLDDRAKNVDGGDGGDGSDGDGNPSNHLYFFLYAVVAPITERISNGIIAEAELRRPCSIRCE